MGESGSLYCSYMYLCRGNKHNVSVVPTKLYLK